MNAESCYEVAFSRAVCRITVSGNDGTEEAPAFRGQMWLVDDDHAIHALVDAARRPLEIHAPSKAGVVGSATTFLEHQFGALTEYAYEYGDVSDPPTLADPVVIKNLL